MKLVYREDNGKKNYNYQAEKLCTHIFSYRINYCAWLLQLGLWNSVFIISKIVVFISEFLLRDVLDGVSHFLLGWIEKYPNFELVLVMMVVPVIMNGLAFWVVDNFLKKRDISQEIVEVEGKK